jgi:hypothetical protein
MHKSIPYTLDAYYIKSILSNSVPLKAKTIKPHTTPSPEDEHVVSAKNLKEKSVDGKKQNGPPKKKIIIKKKQPVT